MATSSAQLIFFGLVSGVLTAFGIDFGVQLFFIELGVSPTECGHWANSARGSQFILLLRRLSRGKFTDALVAHDGELHGPAAWTLVGRSTGRAFWRDDDYPA